MLFDAVVAKDKKDREAVKRMAAEEQREEMVTVLGAPAAKRQAKKKGMSRGHPHADVFF